VVDKAAAGEIAGCRSTARTCGARELPPARIALAALDLE
jgi:hypothetical protein